MFPTLSLGPFVVPSAPLILLAGLWMALTAVERAAARTNQTRLTGENLYNLVFVSLVAGVLGARLVYAARHWDVFAISPLNIFSLNIQLLDPLGGLAAAVLAGVAFGYRLRLPLRPALDISVPGLAIMQLALGLAHLASGDAFGLPTGLPWAIELWEAERHPTQIYEILAGAVILVIVWPRPERAPAFWGVRWWTFIGLSAAAHLFIDGFRADTVLLENGLRLVQLIAWLALAASLWGLGRLRSAPTERNAAAKPEHPQQV